ncbi:hypothetical protein SAMN05216334_11219 [Nitrosomonas ureae]|uniref:Uncharacterized protein n=1 Tax=Nitrosomonas ureae TaxID=44577 RepID=A0A1H5VF04_9PROT|nr:hypothetical protein SAMN05216334_11219 [Nitrosomonas ureae]
MYVDLESGDGYSFGMPLIFLAIIKSFTSNVNPRFCFLNKPQIPNSKMKNPIP